MRNKLLTMLVCLMTFIPATRADDSISVSLLTCQPGKIIYELYGHTALLVQDFERGTQAVYNYGMFDFSTPHFIWRFTLGKTDYLLGAESLRHFVREYYERGSKVYCQTLNLTQEESRRLRDLLEENCLPQNREYRYNFLFNNCATMALDKILESIDGQVTFPPTDSGLSFRSILTEHTCVRPWSQFGVDLIVGAESDLPLQPRQESFAPLYLMDMVSKAVITSNEDSADTVRPLASPSYVLVSPDHEVDFGQPLLTPIQVMWLLFMTVLLLCLLGWYREKQYRIADAILFGLQGVTGAVIGFLYFFSEHPTMDSNWLVIVLNPIPLVCLPFMLRNMRKGRTDWFLIGDFIVCAAFTLFSPAIPQDIEPAVIIFTVTLALRALSSIIFLLFKKKRAIHGPSGKSRIAVAVLLMALAPASMKAKTDKRPKLVVGIVVDQLESECLEKMLPVFDDDGLKRLWNLGYNRTDASFDFEGADLASGMASLYTGASPFQHGIVASRWMNRKTLNVSSPFDDSNFSGINTIEHSSPVKLLASNLADEMKLGSDGKAKICSIAIERDAAILAAGHEADVAIWMNSYDCRWCSSDYYGILPSWINERNEGEWQNVEWKPAFPTGAYVQISDSEHHRPFSYTFRKDDAWDFRTSPFANDKVTEMALAAIDGMGLGRDDTPDLLALTFYAGNFKHAPNSIRSLEQQDIYVRLDRNVADLIRKINDTVGLDNVLFFLTSTGYTETGTPELGGTRIPTGNVSMERVTALLNLYLSAKYGSGSYIETYHRNQIFLNRNMIEDNGLAMHSVLESCVDLLVQVSGIRNVLLMRNLMSMVPDMESARKRNAFNNSCSGDIIIETIPGWSIQDEKDGKTIYRKPADSPFPIILYGNGIRSEINHDPISASVLAPTIASLTGNDIPNACQTHALKNLK